MQLLFIQVIYSFNVYLICVDIIKLSLLTFDVQEDY